MVIMKQTIVFREYLGRSATSQSCVWQRCVPQGACVHVLRSIILLRRRGQTGEDNFPRFANYVSCCNKSIPKPLPSCFHNSLLYDSQISTHAVLQSVSTPFLGEVENFQPPFSSLVMALVFIRAETHATCSRAPFGSLLFRLLRRPALRWPTAFASDSSERCAVRRPTCSSGDHAAAQSWHATGSSCCCCRHLRRTSSRTARQRPSRSTWPRSSSTSCRRKTRRVVISSTTRQWPR
jgi:hypothetical protein